MANRLYLCSFLERKPARQFSHLQTAPDSILGQEVHLKLRVSHQAFQSDSCRGLVTSVPCGCSLHSLYVVY